jgi:hypothetical protein
VIITGDKSQIDLPTKVKSGLVEATKILQGIKGISFIELDGKDVVRHRLVRDIIMAYDKADAEKEAQKSYSSSRNEKKYFKRTSCYLYTTFAQSKCGVVFQDSLNQTINQRWLQQKSSFEYQVQQYTNALKASGQTAYSTIRIPVVVHVIHNTASKTIGGTNNINISDEQILSQIQTLNEDYRRKEGTAGFNTNPIGADMQIEFFLADSIATGETTKGITAITLVKSDLTSLKS